MAALVGKVALVLFALPVTCLTLCTFGVGSIHGWMMRHSCPLAHWAMDPPSHPMGASPRDLPRHR